jgi:hypothetical protein
MITEPAMSPSRPLFLGIANTTYEILNYSTLAIDPSYDVTALDSESSAASF